MGKARTHRPVVIAIGIVIALAACWCIATRWQEISTRRRCSENLRALSDACMTYGGFGFAGPENDRSFSDSLIAFGVLSDNQTRCPATGKPYEVRQPPLLSRIAHPSECAIAWDAVDNHHGGGNVVFADGHSTFLKTDDFAEAIAPCSTTGFRQD